MLEKVFYSGTSEKYCTRAIDAKILDELEMLFGDEDYFSPLRIGLERPKYTGRI